ncbi:DUF805 domain-containing protein [Leptolyngbya subtilissima]|uniref:DUF805 domain-containing protein n=1 Tax=Leptolyngbya subtilissima TaxID=1346803 RepID=UPI003D659F27
MILRLFPKELNRLQYLLRIVVYLIVVFSIYFIVESAIDIEKIGFLILGLQVLKIVLFDLARIRHIGRSPWFVILFFIPYLGALFQLLLFVLPPDNPPTLRY